MLKETIVNGDKITGITTMLTSLGMDEGDMCLKKEIEISENMTDADLREDISQIAPNLLYDTIKKLYNKELTPVSQNAEEATYAGKFTKDDGKIDFKDTAQNIHNKVRGLYSWPTCYFEFKDKKIKVFETEVMEMTGDAGAVLEVSKSGIVVGTGKGGIKLKTVQPESKNKMPAFAWNNSAHLKTGDIIC